MKKIKQGLAWVTSSKLRLLIFLGIILLLGFGVTRIFGNAKSVPSYQTASVERGTIVSSISASGTVLTANISTISSNASGVVKAVYVKDGDTVAAGQKIAEFTLDTAEAQKNAAAWASYLSAKNAVDSANVTLLTLQSDMFAKWDEFKILAEGDAYENSDGTPRFDQRGLPQFHISNNDWLAAEQKYKNQQAVIVQAQAALSSSWLSYQLTSPTIYAPQNGTITNITIVPGMTLSASVSSTDITGNRVAVIEIVGNPLVSVNLSEIDVPRIIQGQKSTITIDALTDKTFTGTVVSIDRIGNSSSGVVSYPAVIKLDTDAPGLLPNMAVTANIVMDSKTNVLLVPSGAVQTQNDEPYIRVLRNGVEQLVPVEIGLSSDTQTEIVSGLQEGTEIITGLTTDTTTTQTRSVFGGLGGGFRVAR